MKHSIICIVLIVFFGCSNNTNRQFTAQKDKVTFYNRNSKQLNKNIIAIYLWDKKRQKVSKTRVEGTFIYSHENTLTFVPDFPLLENTEYVLVKNHKKERVLQRFLLPRKNNEPLLVEAVYPTSDSLPENLLRMYISFSQPMKTTGNLEYIKLYNNKGKEIKGAIFNNVYELWDTSQKQLTIIFDPSRVKTGLVANKELGRALKPGENFRVVITKAEDIYGQQLQEPYVKSFWVTPQDIISPDVTAWKINTPVAGTKEGLKIQFKSPIDKMSLYTRINVADKNNRTIMGKITVSDNEKLWTFIPHEPWKAALHTLRINSRLADPSGNNLNGLFDHKAGSLKSKKEGKIITIPFQIE